MICIISYSAGLLQGRNSLKGVLYKAPFDLLVGNRFDLVIIESEVRVTGKMKLWVENEVTRALVPQGRIICEASAHCFNPACRASTRTRLPPSIA